MSKPRINKTITTKGGSNIFIPKEIIYKEYPEGNGDEGGESTKEPDIYVIKVPKINDYGTNNNWRYGTKLEIRYLLYQNTNTPATKAFTFKYKTNTSETDEYIQGIFGISSSLSGTARTAKLTLLEFWTDDKDIAIEIIKAFKYDVELEYNFDYTREPQLI